MEEFVKTDKPFKFNGNTLTAIISPVHPVGKEIGQVVCMCYSTYLLPQTNEMGTIIDIFINKATRAQRS